MTIRQKASASAFLLCALALVVPAPASAQYLDPGAASIVVQAVVAGVVAVAAGLKLYWSKLSSIFSRRRPDDTASSDR